MANKIFCSNEIYKLFVNAINTRYNTDTAVYLYSNFVKKFLVLQRGDITQDVKLNKRK